MMPKLIKVGLILLVVVLSFNSNAQRGGGVNAAAAPDECLFALEVNSTPAYCPLISDGTIRVKPLGGNAPYIYKWTDNGNINLLANAGTRLLLAPGSYAVEITDAFGCKGRATITIGLENQTCLLGTPCFAITNFTVTNATCLTSKDGSATVNVPSIPAGAGSYKYTWTIPPGVNGVLVNGATISNAPPGIYRVKVAKLNTLNITICTREASVAVGIKMALCPSQPNSCFSAITETIATTCQTSCDGSANVLLTGGSGDFVSYWSNGNYLEGNELRMGDLCSGDYSVTVVDRGALAALGISSDILPSLLVQLRNSQCYVKTLTFHIDNSPDVCRPPGSCYELLNGDVKGTFRSPCFCPLNVQVSTEPARCTESYSGIMRASISGGASTSYRCEWSNGQSGRSVTATPGTYTLTVYNETDEVITTATVSVGNQCPNNNCGACSGPIANPTFVSIQNLLLQTVAGIELPIVGAIGNNNCPQGMKLAYNSPYYPTATNAKIKVDSYRTDVGATPNYRWTGGISSNERFSLSQGNYNGTATYADGCIPKFGATLFPVCSANPTPPCEPTLTYNVYKFSGGTAPCDYRLHVNASGGYGGHFEYSTDGITYSTAADFLNVCLGVVTVYVRSYNDVTGDYCDKTFTITITEAEVCNLDVNFINPRGPRCPSACDGSVEIQPFGGTAPYTILWQDGQTIFTRNDLCYVKYGFKVTDANGCEYIKTFTIPPLGNNCCGDVNFPDNNLVTICKGQSIVITAGGADSYLWSPKPTHSGETDPTATTSPLTNTTYQVTFYQNGCPNPVTRLYTVNIATVPKFGIGIADNTLCLSADTKIPLSLLSNPPITVPGAFDIDWQLASRISGCQNCLNPEYLVNVNDPENIVSVTLTDKQYGCQYSKSAIIYVDKRDLNGTIDRTIRACPGGLIQITPLQYANISHIVWENVSLPGFTGTETEGKPLEIPVPLQPGTYNITATLYNPHICSYVENITIIVEDPPAIGILQGLSSCNGTQVVQVSGYDSYSWTPADKISCADPTCANVEVNMDQSPVTLTVTGYRQNCIATSQITLYKSTNGTPTGNVNPEITESSVGCTWTFSAKPDGGVNYRWIVYEGSPKVELNGQTVSHRFPAPGKFKVTLVISTANCGEIEKSFFVDVTSDDCSCP